MDTAELVERFFKSSTKRAPAETAAAAGEGVEEEESHEEEESSDPNAPDLRLQPVKVKRQRGRPKKRPARRRRPDESVLSATCRCLRCDKDIMTSDVCAELPVFCSTCFNHLCVEGYDDPTLDV